MAETPNVDARVDELTKPGNEAELAKVLNEQFDEASGGKKADDAPQDPPADDKKDDKADPAKADPADPNLSDDPEKNPDGKKQTSDDRFKKILHDRNQAETKVAEKDTEIQGLNKRIDDLMNEVSELRKGKSETDGGSDDDPADDQPMTKKQIAAYLQSLKDKDTASAQQAQATEKTINDQIQALNANPETPDASAHTDKIKEAMIKHPTMSAYAVYCMLKGAGFIGADDGPNSNANKTAVGQRSKSSLNRDKRPEDMSQDELFKELQRAERSGDLSI